MDTVAAGGEGVSRRKKDRGMTRRRHGKLPEDSFVLGSKEGEAEQSIGIELLGDTRFSAAVPSFPSKTRVGEAKEGILKED